MSFDILESFNAALGGPVTRQLSSSLGETEEGTRNAVRSVGPTMLAGLMQKVATPSGAADIFRTVNDERVDSGIVGKLGNILGNRGSMDSARGLGESLAGTVFGNRSGALTSAISQVAGIGPKSAMSLLSMGLPIVFGMLRKQVGSGGLDASGLTSLLFSQRGSLERAGLDDRIAGALGVGSLSNLLSGIPGGPSRPSETREPYTRQERARARPTERPKSRWLPWAIAAGVAALALSIVMNRPHQRGAERTAQTVNERANPSTSVYFDSNEVTVNGEGRMRIASVAASAKGAQDRVVAITGYTDSSGDHDQNMQIAKNRADAVKDALVAEGVTESQIVMDPPAAVTGTGTNDEARRVEIEVR
jgi:outer membrane protein OmpA-like peptidoglycan-associated protein